MGCVSPLLFVCVQLQEFIDTYRMSNEQILRLSETICDTPMIVIKPNYTYMLEELQADLVKTRYEIWFLFFSFFGFRGFWIWIFQGRDVRKGVGRSQNHLRLRDAHFRRVQGRDRGREFVILSFRYVEIGNSRVIWSSWEEIVVNLLLECYDSLLWKKIMILRKQWINNHLDIIHFS